jgi:hypothetical protein
LVVTANALTTNVAVVAEAGTSTEAGVLTAAVRLLATATAMPPLGADCVSVIVQLVVAGPVSVVAAQVSALTDVFTVIVIAWVLVVPFKLALSVTF